MSEQDPMKWQPLDPASDMPIFHKMYLDLLLELFGIPPERLGDVKDTNRTYAEVQEQVFREQIKMRKRRL